MMILARYRRAADVAVLLGGARRSRPGRQPWPLVTPGKKEPVMTGLECVVRQLTELYLILLRRELARRGVAGDLQDSCGQRQLRVYRAGAIPAVEKPAGIVCLAYIGGEWWCCWPQAMVICPITPLNRAAEAIISELGLHTSMRIPGPAVCDCRGGQVSTQAAGTPDERLRQAGHAARAMPLGDPDDWIRIAARAGATAEEIAEAGRVPAGHVRQVLAANGTRRCACQAWGRWSQR
jgi:hypothetical protein